LKDSLLGLIPVFSIVLLLSVFDFIGIEFTLSLLYIIAPVIVIVLSLLILKVRKKYSIVIPASLILKFKELLRFSLLVTSVFWLANLSYWFINSDNFTEARINSVLGVPWLFYPVLMGVCGVIGLLALPYITRNLTNNPAMVFVSLLFLSIIFGKLLTFINVNWIFSGYWEQRFVPLTFSALAVLSSLIILYWIKNIQPLSIYYILLISIVVVTGFSSIQLGFEEQYLKTEERSLSTNEKKQLDILSTMNPDSNLLTFSWRSLQISEMVPFTKRISLFRESMHTWQARSPELVLESLFSKGRSLTMFFRNIDNKNINSSPYNKSYLSQHFINTYQNSSNRINNIEISHIDPIAPPTKNSDIVLLLPERCLDNNYLYAYDFLSLNQQNYTTAYDSDIETIRKAKILVVTSENLASKILEMNTRLLPLLNKILILNLDGCYGEFAELSSLRKKPSFNEPFNISETYKEQRHVVYVDLFPLTIEGKPVKENLRLTEKVGKFVFGANPSIRNMESLIRSNNAAFTEAMLKGNITVTFESVILQTEENDTIELIADGKNYQIIGKNSISVLKYLDSSLEANSMKISGGNGFYINTVLENVTFIFQGNDVYLLSFIENYLPLQIIGDKIFIKMEKCTLLLRNPSIKVSGKGTFFDLYTYREVDKRIRANGDECKIIGDLAFNILYGDIYSIAEKFNYKGSLIVSRTLYDFDEWKYSKEIIPYLILILVIYFLFNKKVYKLD
jgi:hypothetical protein